MSSAVIQLLVLAGIAVFLILRLRNVLGSREGFEKSAAPLPGPETSRTRKGFEVIEGGPDRDIVDHAPEGSEAAKALAAMKLVEPSFSVSEFLQGARGAYEMILTAFDKGELDRIRPFLSQEVFDSFSEVVAARKSRGVTVMTEFQGLRELTLADATFDRAAQRSRNFGAVRGRACLIRPRHGRQGCRGRPESLAQAERRLDLRPHDGCERPELAAGRNRRLSVRRDDGGCSGAGWLGLWTTFLARLAAYAATRPPGWPDPVDADARTFFETHFRAAPPEWTAGSIDGLL